MAHCTWIFCQSEKETWNTRICIICPLHTKCSYQDMWKFDAKVITFQFLEMGLLDYNTYYCLLPNKTMYSWLFFSLKSFISDNLYQRCSWFYEPSIKQWFTQVEVSVKLLTLIFSDPKMHNLSQMKYIEAMRTTSTFEWTLVMAIWYQVW